MLNHILVPLDGNPGSDVMVTEIRRLAALGASKITLLRAELPVAVDEYSIVSDVILEQSRKYLEDMKDRLSDLPIPVETLAQLGAPATAAVETAETVGASMIAVAAPRGGRLARFLLGSVPERIVQISRIPVLTFPSQGDLAPVPSHGRLRSILVAVKGSAEAAAVLPPVLEVARQAQSRLILTRVLSSGDLASEQEAFEDAEEVLYAAGARCAEAGVDFSVLVEHGDAAGRILAMCRERSVDWIAMATRGRSAIARCVQPSATHRILRECSLPVLTVRLEPVARSGSYRDLSQPRHS